MTDPVESYTSYLPESQVREIYEDEEVKLDNHIISCRVKPSEENVHVHFASGDWVDVPFRFFRPSGNGDSPDFSEVRPIDHGLSLRLGSSYEVSSDTIQNHFLKGTRHQIWKEFRRMNVGFLLLVLLLGTLSVLYQKWLLAILVVLIVLFIPGALVMGFRWANELE